MAILQINWRFGARLGEPARDSSDWRYADQKDPSDWNSWIILENFGWIGAHERSKWLNILQNFRWIWIQVIEVFVVENIQEFQIIWKWKGLQWLKCYDNIPEFQTNWKQAGSKWLKIFKESWHSFRGVKAEWSYKRIKEHILVAKEYNLEHFQIKRKTTAAQEEKVSWSNGEIRNIHAKWRQRCLRWARTRNTLIVNNVNMVQVDSNQAVGTKRLNLWTRIWTLQWTKVKPRESEPGFQFWWDWWTLEEIALNLW